MPRVIFFELNEADRHFFDRYIDEGILPHFAKLRREGAFAITRIPTWDAKPAKSWRSISPWMIWPSVYTGLDPATHGIVGFGQNTAGIQGKCVWDVLDAEGVSTGVFGSLMSYPPRHGSNVRYYVPEALADDPSCIPEDARALQEFCLFGARNYSQTSARKFVGGIRLLARTPKSGVSLKTIARIAAQLPAEKMLGATFEPERAMLLSYAGFDAFCKLYDKERPAFATLHMNHVAYMQHRYWRAAEPGRFADSLSATDARFFDTVQGRLKYEKKLSGWIRRSFVYSDQVLGELQRRADADTTIVVATGLGQRPFDPAKEIYNPVVRLENAEELFKRIGLTGFQVLYQMNPDLTLNFSSEAEAARAVTLLEGYRLSDSEPLFVVQRVGPQLFLELESWSPRSPGEKRVIRHPKFPELALPFEHFVHAHPSNDQSTAHHKDTGVIMAWSPGRTMHVPQRTVPVTAIAPTLLSCFGKSAPPWMRDSTPIWEAVRPSSLASAASADGPPCP